jgi:hypothetical protein
LQRYSQLAFRAPAMGAVAILLAGCYTMFSHPKTDMTEDFRDSRYQDCGTCHRVGFEQPLSPDPYNYVSYPFVGFYDCPWWVDCNGSTFLGGTAAEGGGGGEGVKAQVRGMRFLGSRGSASPPAEMPSTPAGSSVGAAPADDSGSGGSGSGSSAQSPSQGGQQDGRTMKKDSPESKDPKPAARDDRKHDPNGGER